MNSPTATQTEQPDDTSLLRQLWEVGLASGSAGEIDLVALRAEARARLAVKAGPVDPSELPARPEAGR